MRARAIKLRRAGPKSFSMRRFLVMLSVLTATLAAADVPARAQGGGAASPGPDAPGATVHRAGGKGGGAAYRPAAEGPAKARAQRRARRAAMERHRQAARRRNAASRRKRARRVGSRPPAAPVAPAKGHRFPLIGPFTFGGKDARFGAPRKGHTHQGQDMAAAEGTPVVAPRAGLAEVVGYQASGAGHYVVLDGEGEDRDYVFMHLRAGSIAVTEGERVRIGARLGEVGNTGASFGAHLHFEIWVGGWRDGGHPIDPLPLLQAWSAQ